jgi:putative transposase
VCPVKYRRQVITQVVAQTIKNTCLEISECYEIHFVEVGTDEDHVHFLTQSVPMMLATRMVQTIKSITAKEVFKQYPELRIQLRQGKFWISGYYINTVSKYGNETVISNYVKNQGKTYNQIYRNQPMLFEGLE